MLSSICIKNLTGVSLGISVYIKFVWIIWVNQGYILCNCSLHAVKCCLMYVIPVPSALPGFLDLSDFGMDTLSYQRREWDNHVTTSCPKISVLLDHAHESMEVFDFFWQCIALITCTLFGCVFMPVLVRTYLRYSISIVLNFDSGGLAHKLAPHNLVRTNLKWSRFQSCLSDAKQIIQIGSYKL
jgi:hypothetical protein